MNLYLITWPDGGGWDYFDSAVVVAISAASAKKIHPSGGQWLMPHLWVGDGSDVDSGWDSCLWAPKPADVTAKLIGTAHKGQKEGSVICASFNAG